MKALGDSLRNVGLGVGNWRFGVPVTLIASLVAIVLMALSSTDLSLQLTYPWAGGVGRRVAYEPLDLGFSLRALLRVV